MWTKNVNILLSESFEKIKGSELSLLLLKTYSKLYMQGFQVNFCENCMKRYLDEIKLTGLQLAEKHDEAMERTLILKNKLPNQILFLAPIHEHVNLDLLTDEKATEYLTKKWLSESMFEKLPDMYLGIQPETTEEKPKSKQTKK